MGNSSYKSALRNLRRWRPTKGLETLAGTPRTKKRPIALVASTGVGAAIVVAALLVAQPARAVSLTDIAQALQNARALHASHYLVDGGKPGEPHMQEWREGMKYRYRTGLPERIPESDSGSDGKRSWWVAFEDKCVNVGVSMRQSGGEALETVDKMVEQFRTSAKAGAVLTRVRKGEFDVVTFEGKTKYDGSRFKFEVSAERKSGLPLEQRKYNWSTTGKWILRGLVRYEYPADIPDDVFAPQVPEGFALLDNDKAVDSIVAALSGGGDSQTVEGVTITFLGALQERDGTVYLLWKGGAPPPMQASAAVFDSVGKQHVAEFFYEDDDRARERNHGIASKNPAPPVPRDQIVKKIRPLGWHKVVPFYCLQFNPERVIPNTAREYKVLLPVSKSVAPYLKQPDGWVKFESSGQEVGTATFRVKTIPIYSWWFVYVKIDPDKMFNYGTYPATNIGMTAEEVRVQKHERFLRMEREMMLPRSSSFKGGRIQIVTVKGNK